MEAQGKIKKTYSRDVKGFEKILYIWQALYEYKIYKRKKMVDNLKKNGQIIKVNVVYGNEKLVDCMKNIIEKHIKR